MRTWVTFGAGPLQGLFCWTIKLKHLAISQGLQSRAYYTIKRTSSRILHRLPDRQTGNRQLSEAAMSRSFYVDSLIIKDTVRPTSLSEHVGQDFLIPISMHSPGMMGITGPMCPSRKTGTFCVCPLCVTSHIHSSRGGIPLLKGQFPGEAQYCQRVAHHQSPGLAHPGHAPVCTPTSYSVTDQRRYHCLSLGKNLHLFWLSVLNNVLPSS